MFYKGSKGRNKENFRSSQKYKKIKLNLDELSKVTQINQDLIKSNKFLRKQLQKLINQVPIKLCRQCANPKCNRNKGTFLKIDPNILNALKTACNL